MEGGAEELTVTTSLVAICRVAKLSEIVSVLSDGKKLGSSDVDVEKRGLSRLPDDVLDRVDIEFPDEDLYRSISIKAMRSVKSYGSSTKTP